MLFVFTEWGDTIEQLQQVQLTNNHVNDGRNQMKKLSVFSMIAICIFLINSFTTFAERAYPPGESYSVEKITTDSYPNMRLRSQNAEGSWQQDDTGWWWQYPDGSYAINKWEYIDGRWYFFNQDGYMLQGWQNINGEWFYLETTGNSTFPAGAMVTGWYEINNYWYYFYSTAQYEHTAGAMAIGWLNIDGYSYYLYMEQTGDNPQGSMATGWINIGGELFHLDETTGRLIANESITVGLDVYTDSTFRSEFSDVMSVDELFEKVGIPFEKTWNLLFSISEYESSGLPIDKCEQDVTDNCTCVADSKCKDTTDTEYHHKNSIKLVRMLQEKYPAGYYLEVGLAGTPLLCCNNGRDHHYNYGVTIGKQYSYCGANKSNIQHTVRVIQHEMSHMFGCLDSPHDSKKLCTMNGGYDKFPLYTENIWCTDCRNGMFIRSSHQVL